MAVREVRQQTAATACGAGRGCSPASLRGAPSLLVSTLHCPRRGCLQSVHAAAPFIQKTRKHFISIRQALKLQVWVVYDTINLVFHFSFRYQFFLQVKQDVLQGRLPCPASTAAQLGAYAVQCRFHRRAFAAEILRTMFEFFCLYAKMFFFFFYQDVLLGGENGI